MGKPSFTFIVFNLNLLELIMATAKTAAEAPATDVALKAQTALAMASQMEADAGSGFEEASASSYAIPFLQILQSGSPQCKKSDGAYIKGAEEGMLYNTVTQELYDGEKGIEVIPAHFTNRFIEWRPRESGGGFVSEHMATLETEKDDKGRDILPNGNTLVDTRNHYVMVRNLDGTLSPALITMSSTQLKKSRQWMSKMNGIKMKTANGFVTAPMMSRVYTIKTTPEQNDKGSWFGFKIELASLVEDINEYNEAKAFREAVKTGVAKAQAPVEEGIGETAESF
jgi:hypothetical protein